MIILLWGIIFNLNFGSCLQGEFLLTGPGGLGVFVLSQGFSEKPPINFSGHVSALAFHHPYIIAVCKQGIFFYR